MTESKTPRPNEPCKCGSGKKFKKCCSEKKERMFAVKAKFKKGEIIEYTKLEPDGTFTFHNRNGKVEPQVAEVQYGLKRGNGKAPKAIASYKADPKNIRIEDNLHVQQYDLLLAIDTNTQMFGHNKVSVGTAVEGVFIPKSSQGAKSNYAPRLTFEFLNARVNPELLMWQLAIIGLQLDPEYSKRGSVAIIVDSKQADLIKINNKEIPLIDNFYLPDGFTLLYGSSETGSEYFANHLLKLADKVSTNVIRKIKENSDDNENRFLTTDLRYDECRYWSTGVIMKGKEYAIRANHYRPSNYEQIAIPRIVKYLYKIRVKIGLYIRLRLWLLRHDN